MKNNPFLKKYWSLFFFLFVFLVFIYFNISELIQTFRITRSNFSLSLMLAVVLQLIVFFFISLAHKEGLQAAGINRKLKELYPLVLSALAVNISAPTAGVAGAYVFAKDATNKKESAVQALIGILIVMIGDFLAFSVILLFSLVYLKVLGELTSAEIIGTCFYYLLVGLLSYLLFLAYKRPTQFYSFLEKTFSALSKLSKKIRKNKSIYLAKLKTEAIQANYILNSKPIKVIEIIAFALVAHFFNILSLLVILESFDLDLKLGIILSSYAIITLLKIVSPTPEGVGIAEGAMTLILTSFGVPFAAAGAITLIYRAISFWLPLFAGFIILNKSNLNELTNT